MASPPTLSRSEEKMAALNLFLSDRPHTVSPTSRCIVSSPYADKEHLLDLHTLDHENQMMARGLARLVSTRDDYATAPYTESFNWDEVMAEVKHLAREQNHEWRDTDFYILAFRSRIPLTTSYDELGVLDKAAHLEAVQSGGLLKYWFGCPDNNGRNLATCVWRSQKDARKGGTGPAHTKAAAATRKLYSEWKIERYRLHATHRLRRWSIMLWED